MSKNHNKYRKDKPWDSEAIDHWKIDEWKPEFLAGN
jgi:ribosomal RNA assembly protein